MIYVLGSINTDFVATVSRMPAAGETMTAQSFSVGRGGKGANQAAAVARLGGEVMMIGKVGGESFGVEAKAALRAAGADVRYVTACEAPTGLAMITVEKGDNRIILSPGANAWLSPADVDEAFSGAKRGDYLIMQLEVPLETVTYAAKRAKEKGMTVVLNPAPAVPLTEELVSSTDIIAPNESETEILTGVNPARGDVELALAVKKLYALGAKRVLITLGGKGAAIAEGQNIAYIPPRKVKVVDTTGAGDTFIGAMTLRLSLGDDFRSAAEFAAIAASITITRKGATASIPTLGEVKAVMERDKSGSPAL